MVEVLELYDRTEPHKVDICEKLAVTVFKEDGEKFWQKNTQVWKKDDEHNDDKNYNCDHNCCTCHSMSLNNLTHLGLFYHL